MLLDLSQIILVICKILHHRIPRLQFLNVHHWHCQPAPEQAGTHGRRTFVDDGYQRHAFTSGSGREYFQIPECEAVHPYEPAFIYPRYGTNVFQSRMLGLFQIHQQGSGRCHSEREGIYGKTFQGFHIELPLEFLYGRIIDECPFIQSRYIVLVIELFLDSFSVASRNYQFFRSK